jgi:hypothetical protein
MNAGSVLEHAFPFSNTSCIVVADRSSGMSDRSAQNFLGGLSREGEAWIT